MCFISLRRVASTRLKLGVDPVTRGWAVVTSAGVVRLGLGFIASLAIARALGPANFGIYAVLAATVGVVGSLAEGGLTEAAVLRISAVRSQQSDAAEVRARAFFWLRLGVSIVSTTVSTAPFADGFVTVRLEMPVGPWAL